MDKNEEQTEDHEETNTSLEEQTSNPLDDTEEIPMLEETKYTKRKSNSDEYEYCRKHPCLRNN